jgi:uroporphyrinogen decarboxylase
LELLADVSAQHVVKQIEAGADCVQIFESWAEGLPPPLFERLIMTPTRRLVRRVRELGVIAPIIGFPRGAGAQVSRYARDTGVSALGVDTQTPADFVIQQSPPGMPLQGNLDPQLLVTGGAALDVGAQEVVRSFAARPHIFNLGHGITPEASPENVARLVNLVRGAA